IALKQAGISEKIIKALASKANPAPAPPVTPVAGPASIPAETPPPATVPQPAGLAGTTPQVAAPAEAGPQSAGPAAAQFAQSVVLYAKEHQWVPLGVETVNWRVGAGKFKALVSAGMVKREVDGVLSGASSKTT